MVANGRRVPTPRQWMIMLFVIGGALCTAGSSGGWWEATVLLNGKALATKSVRSDAQTASQILGLLLISGAWLPSMLRPAARRPFALLLALCAAGVLGIVADRSTPMLERLSAADVIYHSTLLPVAVKVGAVLALLGCAVLWRFGASWPAPATKYEREQRADARHKADPWTAMEQGIDPTDDHPQD